MMQSLIKFAATGLTFSSMIFLALVINAGGWDNFKLRYYHWTQHLNGHQAQALDDLYSQGIAPENHSRIELSELLAGGPPKDGIPSLDAPEFDQAETTPFSADEWVIGVVINGEAKAYPLGIMNWHEIVNDTVGGENVTITYCPLCDTVVAFERENTTFGVSGKLYQSCLVMFDRADDSLYAQPWAMGVLGPKVNEALARIPATKTTLGAWLKAHPESKILATTTGHDRDYFRYPYGIYNTNEELIFPARHQDQRQLHPKTIVSYIWEPDQATPFNQFSGISHQFVHDELKAQKVQQIDFGDRSVQARWDATLEAVIVEELDGTKIPVTTAFSFVYPAFFHIK